MTLNYHPVWIRASALLFPYGLVKQGSGAWMRERLTSFTPPSTRPTAIALGVCSSVMSCARSSTAFSFTQLIFRISRPCSPVRQFADTTAHEQREAEQEDLVDLPRIGKQYYQRRRAADIRNSQERSGHWPGNDPAAHGVLLNPDHGSFCYVSDKQLRNATIAR